MRVAVHNLEEVVGDLVEVGDGAHVEGDDVARALEDAEVAVDAHVLPRREGLLGALRVIRVHPLLHHHGAGAVVDGVLLGGGGLVRLDDLAEQGEVVHLLAVDAEHVVLRREEGESGAGGAVRRKRAWRSVADRGLRGGPVLKGASRARSPREWFEGSERDHAPRWRR